MQLPDAPTAPSPATGRRGGSPWDGILLPLLVLLAVFFGGATQRWSEAVVIGAFSLLLLVLPPRYSLGPVLSIVALLFLALAAAAFLPAHWFGMPDWRVALTKDLGIQLPDTVSPQPWLTLDSFFVLIAGLAWIYYLVTFDASLREIRVSARLFSAGMVLLAALSIYLYLKHQALPSWHNARGFGPFVLRENVQFLRSMTVLDVARNATLSLAARGPDPSLTPV